MRSFEDWNDFPNIQTVLLLRTVVKFQVELTTLLVNWMEAPSIYVPLPATSDDKDFNLMHSIRSGAYADKDFLNEIESSIKTKLAEGQSLNIWSPLVDGLNNEPFFIVPEIQNKDYKIISYKGNTYIDLRCGVNSVTPQFIDGSFDAKSALTTTLIEGDNKIIDIISTLNSFDNSVLREYKLNLKDNLDLESLERLPYPQPSVVSYIPNLNGVGEDIRVFNVNSLQTAIINSEKSGNGEFKFKYNLIDDDKVMLVYHKLSDLIRYVNGESSKVPLREILIGRYIRKNCPGLPDITIEASVNDIKQMVLPPITEIVSGYDIAKYYNEYYYSTFHDIGTLSDSCMRYDRCQKYLGIYVRNSNVRMLILKSRTETDKIIGRALIWDNVKSNSEDEPSFTVLDRYYGPDKYNRYVIEYAKSQGWHSKQSNAAQNFDYITPNGKTLYTESFYVELNYFKFYQYPYLDTFCDFNIIETEEGEKICRLKACKSRDLTSTIGYRYNNDDYYDDQVEDDCYEGYEAVEEYQSRLGITEDEAYDILHEHWDEECEFNVSYCNITDKFYIDDVTTGEILTNIFTIPELKALSKEREEFITTQTLK
jgi:hypothetical protein